METRLSFHGTGGSLFGRLLGGVLLTMLTFGIFLPWAIVWVARWLFENTRLDTADGECRFRFTGGGGRLLGLMLVNGLLCLLTLGIYTPWAVVETLRYVCDGSEATGPDGRPWRLRFTGTGGQAFPILLKGVVFGILTLGIYVPWFLVGFSKWLDQGTRLDRDGVETGTATFDGAGSELLVTLVIGVLLMFVTLGLYEPWFQVSLWRYFHGHTRFTVNHRPWSAEFDGTGWNYFLQLLIGVLLTMVTLGIYTPWMIARIARFRLGHSRFLSPDAAEARPA